MEIYRGKKGWHDPFNQQGYEHETALSNSALEADKRFEQRAILEYSDLNNELTGYRPMSLN